MKSSLPSVCTGKVAFKMVLSSVLIASVRVYREGRHGSQRWASLAAFSEATDLFRFRCIPGLTVTTDHFLICDDFRYDIVSVEDVKGRGMYIEVLAKRRCRPLAKCDMKMPEDFLLKISKLGSNFDSVADTVLQAGGEVVLKKSRAISPPLLAEEQNMTLAPRANWKVRSVFLPPS